MSGRTLTGLQPPGGRLSYQSVADAFAFPALYSAKKFIPLLLKMQAPRYKENSAALLQGISLCQTITVWPGYACLLSCSIRSRAAFRTVISEL